MLNKKVFTTEDNGNKVELAILRASPKQMIDAQLIYNKEWHKAEENGSPLRINLDDIAKRRNLWSDEKAEKVKELEDEVLLLERKLRGGAASLSSKEEGREIALKIKKLRAERLNLLITRNSLDRITAESFADSARIQYMVAATTVYNDRGNSFFKSFEDFIERSNDKCAVDATNAYLELVFSDQENSDDQLFENIYLRKYNYADNKNRLIDSQGRLIDEENHLLDENSRYINEAGEYIDSQGNKVDKDGNYLIIYVDFPE
jgi:hypothetical protein